MELPAMKFLNEGLIEDLTNLNNQSIAQKQGNINDLLNKLSKEVSIIDNFNIINNHMQDFEKKKDDLDEKQKMMISGLVLYTRSYVDVNNMISEYMQEKKEVTINDLILHLVKTRYSNLEGTLKKDIYQNEYSHIMIKIIEGIQQCNQVQKMNENEMEFNNLMPNFMRKIIEAKALTNEDDFTFASFSITTQLTTKLFRRFFELMKELEKAKKSPGDSGPASVMDDPKNKVLTKKIPTDGPPRNYKKNTKKH